VIDVVVNDVISTTDAVELDERTQTGAAGHVIPKFTVTEVTPEPVVTVNFCGLPETAPHPVPQVSVAGLAG
jgi:hypothetical protein